MDYIGFIFYRGKVFLGLYRFCIGVIMPQKG